MGKRVRTTTFVSRGRLSGLLRDELPAGVGQNRTSLHANRDNGQAAADDALVYRARLILGDSLPRPER